MNTNKEDMRELAAQLYAVVVSSMSGNELKSAVQNLIKTTKDSHVCCKFWNTCPQQISLFMCPTTIIWLYCCFGNSES